MCIRIDVEKNAFLGFFPLNLETNPVVLTDESNPEDNLPQGKILTLFLLKVMKFSTSSMNFYLLTTQNWVKQLYFCMIGSFLISNID